MPRRTRRRPYSEPHPELDAEGMLRGTARTESGSDGATWVVRPVAGTDKRYRCPGCGQEIAALTPHVVAWTEDHLFGADAGLAERRHWHTSCWRGRERRRPR